MAEGQTDEGASEKRKGRFSIPRPLIRSSVRTGAPSPLRGEGFLLKLFALQHRQFVAAVVVGIFGMACVVAKSAPLKMP
ncbi:hypothetical protein [Intestinimonas timonensis]|uniref:hypothetical protein n=1 Tax=Intestinimonas timonensis TaxID=1689270 RepID=UPI0013EF1B39|nr:hypothetical protein [Intestinimonas timonensis]